MLIFLLPSGCRLPPLNGMLPSVCTWAARLHQTDRQTHKRTLTLARMHLCWHSVMGYGMPVFYSCVDLPWKIQSFTLMRSENSPRGSQRVRQPTTKCMCEHACVWVSLAASVCVRECEFVQINRWATGWLCCQLLLSHTHLHQVN